MTTAAGSDPFESTANPARYLPRRACEEALEAIELALVQGQGPVALTGPAGLGKTLLIQVLGQRLAGRYHVVRLPYPALSGPDLCRWVLDSLGEPAPPDADPEGTLLDCAFRDAAGGRELLLLVDDASALPPGTARSLATLVSASGGAIRAVLAAVDDARLGAALAALGAGVREVRFEVPMDAQETAAYVRARLVRSEDPEGRTDRFDAELLGRIYGATGGVARRVHDLGSLVWRSDASTDLAARIDAWVREDQDRGADPQLEALEIDSAAALTIDDAAAPEAIASEPALEAVADPSGKGVPGEAERLSPPPASDARFRPAPPPGPGTGGVWGVVAILALLAVAMPYLLPRLDAWVGAELPGAARPPEQARDAVSPGPAVAPPRPALEAATLSEVAPALEAATPVASPAADPADAALGAGAAREPGRDAPTPPAAASATGLPATSLPSRPMVRVEVEARPGTVIHVDGGEVGETPLVGLSLSPGLHVFRAEFPGGSAVVRAVEISSENRRIRFESGVSPAQ